MVMNSKQQLWERMKEADLKHVIYKNPKNKQNFYKLMLRSIINTSKEHYKHF